MKSPKRRRIRTYDCIIIGNGPGALTAAMYLGRFRRSCVVVGTGKPRAAWIPKTHNLIGFHKGISGASLLKRMQSQVAALKIHSVEGLASVTRQGNKFKVRVRGKSLQCRTVILATGFVDLQPKVKNLEALRNKGFVRYCPVCDAYEHINKKIAVLVADGAGVERAMFMGRFTKHLTIVGIDGFEFSAAKKRKLISAKVQVLEETLTAMDLKGNIKLNIHFKSGRILTVDAVYVELGCHVNDSAYSLIKGIKKSKTGFLMTSPEQETNVPGVFAVGDCVDNLGQLSVAASQAAIAATEIHGLLSR